MLGGGFFFEEFNGFEPYKYVLFVLGIIIIFFGVYGLAPDYDESSAKETSLDIKEVRRSSVSVVSVYNIHPDDGR